MREILLKSKPGKRNLMCNIFYLLKQSIKFCSLFTFVNVENTPFGWAVGFNYSFVFLTIRVLLKLWFS